MEAEEDRSKMVDGGSEASESGRDSGALVGAYVGRDSSGSRKLLLGKVVSYDATTTMFTIVFEDGRREVFDRLQVDKILMAEAVGPDVKITRRKRKLDQLIPAVTESRRPNTRSRKNAGAESVVVSEGASAAASVVSRLGAELSEDADSSTDSCDFEKALDSAPCAEAQILPLPPSSGDINIPEEAASYLFSAYNFLRSFSLQLFLSPFGLDEFVGSLNCTVQNSLLDAIHVSLMRALRRHLQTLSLDGSELASKCLRHHDWTLLDSLTWPAILIDYLHIMGYAKGLDETGFICVVSGGEYYGLPVATKLKVLQVLCDDVIDSAELRAELDMREDIQVEEECSEIANLAQESGLTRVHPRNSKTSACKSFEALENSVVPRKQNLNSKASEPTQIALDIDQDGNSDECRLCSMDGTLICCDGCPSAYHSRCIGLNKAFLPDGLWFCPECTVNNLGSSSSKIGRGARGAEIFGVDANGWMFLGTCNYLLVIGTSLSAESLTRYYNHVDITKVLNLICSTGERALAYADICTNISKYWQIPLASFQTKRIVSNPIIGQESDRHYIPQSITSPKGSTNELNNAEENHASNVADGNLDNMTITCKKGSYDNIVADGNTSNFVEQTDFPVTQKYSTDNLEISVKKAPGAANETLLRADDERNTPGNPSQIVQKNPPSTHTKFSEQLGTGSVVTDTSYSDQPISAGRSILQDIATFGSGNENGTCREDAGSSILSAKNEAPSISYESRLDTHVYDDKCRVKCVTSSKVPSLFKPHVYINQYTQGDIAASAAANLAVLASEEGKVPEAHVSSNYRKAVAANVALQMKAFSGVTMNFMWPSSEKKLMEVPRERCGWCIACKSSSTTKKGCFLNVAAINAIKRSPKNSIGLRPVKHDVSYLPVIAAQIANMEESLRGLIVGALLDTEYNRQWRKQVSEASSCRALKFLLLELEKNIRGIAFSGGWIKLVDDWVIEFAAPQIGLYRTGNSQKRTPVGRRHKRLSCSDSWMMVKWSRGGKLSKVVFQKGALPSSLVRKAGRQGGIRRIPGIHYSEGYEFPRRNRQFAWRASVEMCKNPSQLALQVRYLDAHLRWRDLRPEQIPVEGRGTDADATAFRNAAISDKKIVENKITYALVFPNQKHLPLRVTKNILEAEKTQDENEKLWFSENHIPLYLIKEYEEKIGMEMSYTMMTSSHVLPKMQRKEPKSRVNVFTYLMYMMEKPSKCAVCQLDVSFRDVVKCNTCEGFYHWGCTIPLTAVKKNGLEVSFTCSLCHRAKTATPNDSCNKILKVHLSSSGQYPLAVGSKCVLQSDAHHSGKSVGKTDVQPEMKSCASGSNSDRKAKRGGQSNAYGLIWKQKGKDSGNVFRVENIILKSKDGMDSSRKPICCLCNMPYRSDLMYIRCEQCLKWYHGDSVELEESQIFDLMGFKCCKCRKKIIPRCPYAENYKKPDLEPLKQPNAARNRGSICKVPNLDHSTSLACNSKLEDFVIANDPLLYSVGRVEPIAEQMLGSEQHIYGPGSSSKNQQKLSVRRPQTKNGNAVDISCADQDANCRMPSFSAIMQYLSVGANPVEPEVDPLSTEGIEWDSSMAGGYGGVVVDNSGLKDQFRDPEIGINGNVEYEPQTYFSFTELLASGDDQMDFVNNMQNGQLDSMPMDTTEDCYFADFGATYENVSADDSSGAYEMGLGNQCMGTDGPGLAGMACQRCKLNQPSPDLACEICFLTIHSHCSPWVESEEPSDGSTHWRCGSCRDWR